MSGRYLFRAFFLSMALATLSACSETPQDTRPGQPVATRQAAFKEMVRTFEPMGVMLRQGPFDEARFREHFARFRSTVDKPWPHFAEDTCYPPAKVTPAACSDLKGLQRRAEAFREAVAALEAVLAESSVSADALRAPYERVYQTCQDCHREYRKK